MSDKPKFIIVSREDLERAIMQALRRSKLDIDGDEAQRIVLRTLAYLPVTGPVPQFETLPTHCECAPRECKGEGIFSKFHLFINRIPMDSGRVGALLAEGR